MADVGQGSYQGSGAPRGSSLGIGNTPVLDTYNATTPFPKGVSTPTYHELEPTQGAEHFHRAIGEAKAAHPAGAAVTQYPAEDYKNMRLFSTPEGDAGFALKGDDIVSVFKHPTAPYRHVTRSMLDLAVGQGGRRLDAFDTVLPRFYSQSGFRAVARTPFNDQYKPDGWDYSQFKDHNGGRPDVVFMAHDPQAGLYQPWDGERIADYDEGAKRQDAALAQVRARGNVPATPGPESYGSGQLIRMAPGGTPTTIWHGTPHQFPPTRANPLGEFDLSKIGTGEGNQSYAYGPYAAGNEAIAKNYQERLSEGERFIDTPEGRVHERDDIQDLTPRQRAAMVAAFSGGDPGRALTRAHQYAEDPHAGSLWGEAISHLRDRPEEFRGTQWQSPGNLYQAELHVHPDHLLDWDKRLYEQSPYVQERVVPHVKRAMDLGYTTGVDPLTATGEEAHSAIASLTPEFEAGGVGHIDAAQHLLNAGIPGIRYADANSRDYLKEAARLKGRIVMLRVSGAPQRDIEREEAYLQRALQRISHNYVIFDPRTIHITRRNGLPAMIAAGADALRDHKAGTVKTADLPPDMRSLLGDFIGDNPVPEQFAVTHTPLSHLPDVKLDEYDRGSDYARAMKADEVPPILVAHGKFIDGKHRVFAARQRGDQTIKTIDLTGIADPKAVDRNSMGMVGP